MIEIPKKFEVKATQDEPLAVEIRIGKNMLLVSAGLILLTAYYIRTKR